MSQNPPTPFRRAGDDLTQTAQPFPATTRGRLVLCLATVAMLSLAFAPIKQFYFAWIALVPWMVLVGHAQSKKATFFWSWITGICFFSINMWWIGYVTVPGAMALMLYMGFWFAVAALVWRGAGVLRLPDIAKPQAAGRMIGSLVLIAAVWVAVEFTWGNLFTGLPWLYLGHSQTPILAMCQIADLTSAYGVTFWVVLVNAWLAHFVLHRLDPARLLVPGAAIAVFLVLILAYGLFRMNQNTTYPGPMVMVVQPNYPQDNSGAKGAGWAEILAFHSKTTRENYKTNPDLVIWSETMMPELNGVYRDAMHEFFYKDDHVNAGVFLDSVYQQLGELASSLKTNLLVGGHTMLPDRPVDGKATWNRRNSAYLFDRNGRESTLRYDKIHLVPFGEYMPFRESFPPLYKFFDLFNPYKGSDYTVQAGSELTLFPMEATSTPPATYHFVPAICFEDVDSPLMARAIAGPNGGKRADFIVNLTNDGWFATPQMQQHLQLSVYRCIENRVPTARSVNTGVSGYIDPVGRVYDTIPVHTTGARVARLTLDHRVGPYTHVGDVFGWTCFAAAAGAALAGMVNGVKARRAARR